MIDKHLVRELILYIENTSELYPQYQALAKNYARKKRMGTYNPELAVKGVVNLVRSGITMYKKELGSLPKVNAQEKWAVASELLAGMDELIEDYRGQAWLPLQDKYGGNRLEAGRRLHRKLEDR